MGMLFGVALMHLFAVASPGPDFFLVLRNSMSRSSGHGVWTSAGIMLGVGLHITLCLTGIVLLIQHDVVLQTILKALAAAYLFYLAYQSFAAGNSPGSKADWETQRTKEESSGPYSRSFREGLLCNILNPKATLFFWALFGTLLDQGTTSWILYAAAGEMVIANFLWFALLARIAGSSRFRRRYAQSEKGIQYFFAFILFAFAFYLVYEIMPWSA